MNTLHFDVIEQRDAYSGKDYLAVHILVDGVDLLDRIIAIESASGGKEKEESGAPPFEGLEPVYLFKNLTRMNVNEDNTTTVLECICHSEGCCDFVTEIIENDDTVVWTDFKRAIDLGYYYSSLNGMEFDKEEYWREVERLKDYFGQKQE